MLSGNCGNATGLTLSVLEGLKNMLDDINPYVKIFRSARDILEQNHTLNLHLKIIHSRGDRQYIQPSSNEIAALIVGENSGQVSHRDIILLSKHGNLQRINEINPSYMPL